MKKRSNLDIIGADKAIFCLKALLLSYRPPIGLAAARMDVLAFRVACQKTSNKYKHKTGPYRLLKRLVEHGDTCF